MIGRKSEMPMISVVLPTFNRSDLLKAAIESVVKQTFSDWEIVVIDNFSSDDTRSVVNSFADPRIRFFQFANGGVIGRSRNFGIKNARGNFIAFLDSDDAWLPNKLELSMNAMSDNDLVCHNMTLVEDGIVKRKLEWLKGGEAPTFDRMLFRENFVSTSTVLARKANVMGAGMFSEAPEHAGFEDMDLWLKMLRNGCKFKHLTDTLTLYAIHTGNFTTQSPYNIHAAEDLLRSHYTAGGFRGFRNWLQLRCRIGEFYFSAGRRLYWRGQRVSAARRYFSAFGLAPNRLLYLLALIEAIFVPRFVERSVRKV
jgi:glycosyltransferase involved in cell wall biosynthesis